MLVLIAVIVPNKCHPGCMCVCDVQCAVSTMALQECDLNRVTVTHSDLLGWHHRGRKGFMCGNVAALPSVIYHSDVPAQGSSVSEFLISKEVLDQTRWTMLACSCLKLWV